VPPAPAGRDEAGRFTAGNPGGPGNPFARQVGARRKALLDAVSPEDVGRVAKKLYELALAGDVAAGKVLLAYVVGKPAEAVNPDRLDLDEFRLLRESPNLDELGEAFDRIVPALAASLAGEKLSADREQYTRLVDERVEEMREQLAEMRRDPLFRRFHEDEDWADDESEE
jgi:hypothetical protein